MYVVQSKGQISFFCLSFSQWMISTSLSKTICSYMWGFISGLSDLFYWSMCLSLSSASLVWLLYLCISFEIRRFETTLISFSRLFWLLRVSWDFTWILGFFFLTFVITCWNFDRDHIIIIIFVSRFIKLKLGEDKLPNKNQLLGRAPWL